MNSDSGVQFAMKERISTSSNKTVFGVWAPSLTPLQKNYLIDHAALLDHVRWLLANGCHGVALFGTTGEAPSFSADERIAALEYLLRHSINPASLMIGNGFSALTDTINVTQHAVEAGCTTFLMIPPFYFKDPSIDGIADSYRHVLDQVEAPEMRVVLYHFPKLSMVPISHELIRLLKHSHGHMIAGLKDSSGDWSSVQGFIEAFPTLSVLPGSEVFLLRALNFGGAGTITATANINPDGIRKVFDQWLADEQDGQFQRDAETVRAILSQFPLAAALKAVHAQDRGQPHWESVRPPLEQLSDQDRAKLSEALLNAGFELAK